MTKPENQNDVFFWNQLSIYSHFSRNFYQIEIKSQRVEKLRQINGNEMIFSLTNFLWNQLIAFYIKWGHSLLEILDLFLRSDMFFVGVITKMGGRNCVKIQFGNHHYKKSKSCKEGDETSFPDFNAKSFQHKIQKDRTNHNQWNLNKDPKCQW